MNRIFNLRNLAVFAVSGLLVFILWYAFFRTTAEASAKPMESYKWVEVGTEWEGTCEVEGEVVECGTTAEGIEAGILTEECQKVATDDKKAKPECKKGDVRYTNVTRSCEVVGDACPMPVVPVVEEQDAPNLSYTQGPDMGKGDGMCKLQWKQINGSKKVEIRFAEDHVFGNGYQTVETVDDGAYWLPVDEASVKIRGRDSKGEWSDTEKISC